MAHTAVETYNMFNQRPVRASRVKKNYRWTVVNIITVLFFLVMIMRLWQLQITNYALYTGLASGQQDLYRQLFPKRGSIYASERSADGGARPVALAINRRAYLAYANTRLLADAPAAASALADILNMPAEELAVMLSEPDDPYVPLKRRVSEEAAEKIKQLDLSGIALQEMTERLYPNNNIGSHIIGFVSYRDNNLVGQYGLEGAFDEVLSGTIGEIRSERDAAGVWIPMADKELIAAEDGADLVLTIDWPIQFNACRSLDDWVKQHGADGGSIIVVDPKSGAILAMCGSPDFNPNIFNENASIGVFNNPAIFLEYEPGSIMKPMTMAAAIDQEKVRPDSTYDDAGEIKFGTYVIRNSDNKAYGRQTMTEVLKKSLNTGAVYAMRQLEPSVFEKYLNDFGFGALSGIELRSESAGNISRLSDKNEIYRATASFGQGITATPLQMVNAYAVLANGGKLLKPHIVKEIIFSDGRRQESRPEVVRQVISERTASVLAGMLVAVVEEGHGKRAAVDGYYIAGKTGTAQIPRRDGPGYEEGASIGSFVGFGPVDDPRFAMIVRVDRPRDVQFAESSAAPLFGKIAKFILQYYEVPPRKEAKP